LGFATRNKSEVRDEWRNTPSKAKSDFTMHRAELKKTAGGPAHKAPSSQLETVIALYQDSASFKGIERNLNDKHALTSLFHRHIFANDSSLVICKANMHLLYGLHDQFTQRSSKQLSGFVILICSSQCSKRRKGKQFYCKF
jgi:hypothetical protein